MTKLTKVSFNIYSFLLVSSSNLQRDIISIVVTILKVYRLVFHGQNLYFAVSTGYDC